MSADKYPSIFSRQIETIVYIYPNFQNCARCVKDLKYNQHDSLHLGQKNARIFVAWTLSVPRSSQFSSSYALRKLTIVYLVNS